MKLTRTIIIFSALFILAACTASTRFQSSESDLQLKINQNAPFSIYPNSPTPQTYNTTSFGQFIFEASKEGQDPMYGLMPLKFNGGYLALDILFFAPAMFFNLREVYPYYEIDINEGIVRYKKAETDPWLIYKPTAAEIERAKAYFNP